MTSFYKNWWQNDIFRTFFRNKFVKKFNKSVKYTKIENYGAKICENKNLGDKIQKVMIIGDKICNWAKK